MEESAVVAPTRRNEIVAPVAPSTDRQLISSSTTTDRSSSFNSKQFMPSTKPSTSEPVPYSSLNSKSTPDSLSAVETAGLKETQNVRPTRSVEKQPTSKTQTSIQISSDNGVNKDRHHRKELQGRQSVPIIKQSISNDALQRFNMQQEDKLKLLVSGIRTLFKSKFIQIASDCCPLIHDLYRFPETTVYYQIFDIRQLNTETEASSSRRFRKQQHQASKVLFV